MQESLCSSPPPPHALLPLAASRGHRAARPALARCVGRALFAWWGSRIPQWPLEEKSKIPVVWLPSLPSPACRSPSEPDFCSGMSSFPFCLCSTYQKRLEPDDFFCRVYNFIGEKREFVKQSMGLVAPRLLQDVPTPFSSLFFCSLKAEISIAVDALPGTLAGLLSLGCGSRNHRSFSLSFVIKGRGAPSPHCPAASSTGRSGRPWLLFPLH